jgi:hypothetical protein
MVVGFATTNAISAYHYWCCECESRPGRGVQHYVIKCVSDLRQVGSFIKIKKYEWPKVQLKRSLSKEHQRLRQTHTGKLNDFYTFCYHFGWFMVLNATFNNISVIQLYWWRKLPTCRKSLTHFIT